ncbi:putative transposable element [Trichonephila clavipes]|nr:putative transposable element [Trichonephila clavipes]
MRECQARVSRYLPLYESGLQVKPKNPFPTLGLPKAAKTINRLVNKCETLIKQHQSSGEKGNETSLESTEEIYQRRVGPFPHRSAVIKLWDAYLQCTFRILRNLRNAQKQAVVGFLTLSLGGLRGSKVVKGLIYGNAPCRWNPHKAGGIIGPYFFKNDEGLKVTVNGDRYRAMITHFFVPELNNHDVQELWFQQEGATCHTARSTIDLLKDTFGDRLFSRFGPVNWPPISWDLTPLDYFLWSYVK